MKFSKGKDPLYHSHLHATLVFPFENSSWDIMKAEEINFDVEFTTKNGR